MGMNKGYLTARNNKEGDETYTPRYAVEPIVKYLKNKRFKHIWCPFDLDTSFFVRVLRREGFIVHATHIENGQDFFTHNLPCHCIVSNPPFSCKDEVLERLYKIGKPFMILLPQNALQSQKRTSLFIKKGLEYLGFDNRIHFYTRGKVKLEENFYGDRSLIIGYNETIDIEELIKKKQLMRWETDEEMYSKIKLSNHFAAGYFCHNVLPDKLILEHLKIIQEPYGTPEQIKMWSSKKNGTME